MKKWCPIAVLQTLLLLLPVMSMASDPVGSELDVVDIVYEWDPQGTVIQVGNYNVSYFESVWVDVGKGEPIQGTASDIVLGGLVKAILIDKDEDRRWLANRIIVYRGDGLEQALAIVSEDIKKQVLQKQKEDQEGGRSPENKQDLKLENGVWTN